MSSLPPGQQSLGGGIFNTVTKVWTAVGLGISASIYNAESTSASALQTEIKPYRAIYWFCVASAAAGCLVVPFLTIGTQGHSTGTSVASLNEHNETQKYEENDTPEFGDEKGSGGVPDKELV